MASKCIPKVARSRPCSVSLRSLTLSLHLHLQTRSIIASKCNLWVHWISVSNCISKLTQLRPQSASLSSLNLGLQLHPQSRSITASQCISVFTQSRSSIASPNLLDHGLSSLDLHFQTHLKMLSSTACSQSRYTVYRWLAIKIHRYIHENTNWMHEF